MKIVFASGNRGKLEELGHLRETLGWEIIPQSDCGVNEVPETGTTFVENAIIKARHAAEISGLPSLADDSGLEVDALGGSPGIYSARYAGENADDAMNIDKVLSALGSAPEYERIARYHSVLVYMRDAKDACPIIAHGVWEGCILTERRGTQGFGYDPIFYVPELGCTAGELPRAEKSCICHRGQAIDKLIMQMQK